MKSGKCENKSGFKEDYVKNKRYSPCYQGRAYTQYLQKLEHHFTLLYFVKKTPASISVLTGKDAGVTFSKLK